MTSKDRWLSAAALLIAILPIMILCGFMQILPDKSVMPGLTADDPQLTLEKHKLLYLGLTGLIPAALVIIARILRRNKIVERNFLFMMIASFMLGIAFMCVSVYGIIYNIIEYKIDLLKKIDFFGASVVIISVLLGLFSNYLPSLRRNDVMGIKNRYTMSDNKVWLKVHYTAAGVFMYSFYGFALFVSLLSIWLDITLGWVHVILWVFLMAALWLWGYLYSRHACITISKKQAA